MKLAPEVLAGLALTLAAIAALLIANMGLYHGYHAVLEYPLTLGLAPLSLTKSVHQWVNDGLMALFFATVGIEIKHEFTAGNLANPNQRWLPLIGAVGGFLTPALIFFGFTHGTPYANGWAIPAATDIAFAVALITVFKSSVPPSLRAFLLALAIIDDLMAILAIALFYSTQLNVPNLLLALAALGVLAGLNRMGVRNLAAYAVVGVFLWLCVLQSGVHATLAGVLWGLALPQNHQPHQASPAKRAEHLLQPWVQWLILPLFAFCSTGVHLGGVGASTYTSPLLIATVAGLVIGKPLGVIGAMQAAVRAGLAHKPYGATWRHIAGIGCACGIGFTMSLFIGALAFANPGWQVPVRLGIIIASTLSATLAAVFLAASPPYRHAPDTD